MLNDPDRNSLRNYSLYITIFLVVFVYFWRLGYNDIWNPNEAFYADATREMFIRKNFMEFYFNSELRFNKPPVTYWSIALFVPVLGINEFSIRFPMALMALLSIYLTFLLGRKMFNRNTGILAAAIMALSIQFTVNARYSSPEIPLTFFFTLTMFWFYKGYKDNSKLFLLLSYASLGLTMLCKGYPYIIILGGIFVLYILADQNFKIPNTFKKVRRSLLFQGLIIALIVGLSWPLYMYYLHGSDFLNVAKQETVDRAITFHSKGFIRSLLYYPEINTWGFLPYSMTFLYAIVWTVRNKQRLIELAYPVVWVLVMLIIFTSAKGKLPTYFIQAHPAMSIITAWFLMNVNVTKKWEKIVLNLTLVVPAVAISILSIAFIFVFKLNWFYLIIPALPIMIIFLFRNGPPQIAGIERNSLFENYLKLFPFYALLGTMIIFSTAILTKLETYRPYDKLGHNLLNSDVPEDLPIYTEDMVYHNLPYYTHRRTIDYVSADSIQKASESKSILALIGTEELKRFKNPEIIWQGLIYDNQSEAKFGIFVTGYLKASEGDFSAYKDFSLIYVKNPRDK